MPAIRQKDEAAKFITRRHQEWTEFHMCWRRLQDSLEGGDRYRYAEYGYDRRGFGFRTHNLIRHKREFPVPSKTNQFGPGVVSTELDYHMTGDDPQANAVQDEYEARRARTPVPRMLANAVEKHLSRIYAGEILREGPDELKAWWGDTDGQGTAIDDWMSDTVAPLLYTLGNLDLCFDRPKIPAGEVVESKADSDRLNLDSCVAGFILPENVLWWKLDRSGQYTEVLVCEFEDNEEGLPETYYRHWTAIDSVLYTAEGDVVEERPHNFGRVPIFRAFHKRKFRCRNVGQPALEGVLEKERAYYNTDSERILSNVIQAHPQLQGPAEAMEGGETAVGPGWALPIPADPNGGVRCEWKFLDPPKGAAEFLRATLHDLQDGVDRDTCQTKPAGSASGGGSGASTVSQSGVSKELDQRDGNDLLAKLAAVFQRVELKMTRYVVAAIRDVPVEDDPDDAITITYPGGFSLYSPAELAELGAEIQAFAASCGALPCAEKAMLRRMIVDALPGLSEEEYAEIGQQIDDFVDGRAEMKDKQLEGQTLALPAPGQGGDGDGPSPDAEQITDGFGAVMSPDTTDKAGVANAAMNS